MQNVVGEMYLRCYTQLLSGMLTEICAKVSDICADFLFDIGNVFFDTIPTFNIRMVYKLH